MDSVKSLPEGSQEWHGPNVTIEKYQIQPGVTEVEIVKLPETSEIMYMVREPEISQQQRNEITKLRDLISSLIPYLVSSSRKNAPDMEKMIQSFIRERFPWLSGSVKQTYEYYLNRDFSGYGVIDPIVRDPNVEDISCNGPGIPVFLFHSVYGSIRTNITFATEIDLSSYIIPYGAALWKTRINKRPAP
jgi:Type IV secretory pathway, VirB11 components, and related ATPases involved in archaeal flagella biosynthesis